MTASPWPRIIAHADMDAFYASVEQLDDPLLRGKPVIVGPRSRRGVVLTASYEARPFRVGSAMPMAKALARCPHALVVPPRFGRYEAISRLVMRAFADFSPVVEPISLDEAFIDLTGTLHQHGTPAIAARRIKEAVFAATGLTVSVGVSSTKFVAKVASGYSKPDGLTVVPPEAAVKWLAPLPVASLWGVGAKTEARLMALGYRTVADIAGADPARLQKQLGSLGAHLRALANAQDPRPVARRRVAHSMGSDRTLEQDAVTDAEVRRYLQRSADRLGRRLREKQLKAGGVRVRLKTADFRLLTRQVLLTEPTDVAEELFRVAIPLADALRAQGPFRLVGMAVYELHARDGSEQFDLFASRDRQQRLERAMDAVSHRFGDISLRRARDIARPGTVMGDAPTLDGLQYEETDEESQEAGDWHAEEFWQEPP
ncbi:MAG: DNA polymerase IV [Pseudomonadales bacterium]